jgi:hypothetical protein
MRKKKIVINFAVIFFFSYYSQKAINTKIQQLPLFPVFEK